MTPSTTDVAATGISGVRIDDIVLPGPHGEIPIRIYTPAVPLAEPLGLVWCHGGAFAYGDLDGPESDWVATNIAAGGITVIAVDYRLAPVPAWALELGSEPGTGTSYYPVAADEVQSVFDWATTTMRTASPGGWVLGGASAGGSLTAGVTMEMRDRGRVMPRRLLLAYPLLHATLPEYRPELAAKLAALSDTGAIALDRQTVEAIALNYVNGDAQLLHDPHVFAGGHDLTGFPPTLIVNSDVDFIRASGDAFAAELAAVGVNLVSLREEGTMHGHLSEPESDGAQRSIQRIIGWITSPWVETSLSSIRNRPAVR